MLLLLWPTGLGHKEPQSHLGGVPGLGPKPGEVRLVFWPTQRVAPLPWALFLLRFGYLLSLKSTGEINLIYWCCGLEWCLQALVTASSVCVWVCWYQLNAFLGSNVSVSLGRGAGCVCCCPNLKYHLCLSVYVCVRGRQVLEDVGTC